MQWKAAVPALALLWSLSSLTAGCGNSGAGPVDAAAPDAFIDADFSGWDPAPLPMLRVTTTWLDFGTIDVGASSTDQMVTVVVTGGPLSPTATIVGPGFTLKGSSCDPLPILGSCTMRVAFTPTAIGAASGVLTVDAVGNLRGPAVVALSGIGHAPGPAFPPFADDVALGTLLVNQEATAVVQLAPTRPVATLACTSSSPDLTLAAQTCPSTGKIEAPCTFTFIFKAATAGAKTDDVICAGGGITLLRRVLATVVAPEPPTIYPAAAMFTAAVGYTYVAAFTASKGGNAPAGPLTATLAGSSEFTITSDGCAIPLAPRATCTIQVAFRRESVGVKTAVLTVTDSSQPTPTSASAILTGGGSAPTPLTATPTILDFGTLAIGTRSAPQVFTVTNFGDKPTGPLSVQTIDIAAGGDSAFAATTSCAAGLDPDATCTVTVTFQPNAAGSPSAGFIVTDGTVSTAATAMGTAVTTGGSALYCAGTLSSNVSFASTPVGQTSAEIVCATFDGGTLDGGTLDGGTLDGGALDAGALAIAATTTGDFAVTSQGCTQSQCSVRLVFKPTAQGTRTGTLRVVLPLGSGSSPATVTLTGTGL